MRRSVPAAVLAGLAAHAPAQPQVPPGFTATMIAPLLDGVPPQLEAVSGSAYGTGVLSAVGDPDTGVVSVRLLTPSGALSTVATESFPNASPFFRVVRLRLDTTGLFGNRLHAMVKLGDGLDEGSTLVSFLPDGTPAVEYESPLDSITYTFEFVSGVTGTADGIVALDGDSGSGTLLTHLSPAYAATVTSTNSVPAGRTDTDVQGFCVDPTGLYGGGVLLADTDNAPDNVSAIYELRNVDAGGDYRAVFGPVSRTIVQYGDLDVVASGPFGGVVYVTDQVTDEIQQVAPSGTHTTWATGFDGIDALSIAPDGVSMYVADQQGVWLIRPAGTNPGPTILATDPVEGAANPVTGAPVRAIRIVFTEPVTFTESDVTITDSAGNPVVFNATGSGSVFMVIGLADPLETDVYTVTLDDAIASVDDATPLDGDENGVAGGDAVLQFAHTCFADCDRNTILNVDDIDCFVSSFLGGCD